MTNDTNTLNGALRELGETMAANLTQQGVSSTWDEGLTTLAGKILNISPGPTPTPASITLTSDKSILSYADSESATLSATVKDSSSQVMEGVTVEFFNGSTSMGTATTNSSGVATKSYASAGSGDVSFTAGVGSLVSETYVVEDCLVYDPLTSSSGKWTIPSGVTSNYSSDGWKATASAYKQVKLTDKLTSSCSVEFTLSDYSNTQYTGIIIYAYTNGDSTPNQAILLGGTTNASNRKVFNTTLSHDLIKGEVYRIEYTSSTLKVYEGDTLLGQASSSVGLPTRFEFHVSDNRWAIYKDLKVKPL